jgi:hypothetical protein
MNLSTHYKMLSFSSFNIFIHLFIYILHTDDMIISVYTIPAWSRFIVGIAGSNTAEGTDNRLLCFLYVV